MKTIRYKCAEETSEKCVREVSALRKPARNSSTTKAYAWSIKQILSDGGDEKNWKGEKLYTDGTKEEHNQVGIISYNNGHLYYHKIPNISKIFDQEGNDTYILVQGTGMVQYK